MEMFIHIQTYMCVYIYVCVSVFMCMLLSHTHKTKALLNTESSILEDRSVSKEVKLAWYKAMGSNEDDGKLSLPERK